MVFFMKYCKASRDPAKKKSHMSELHFQNTFLRFLHNVGPGSNLHLIECIQSNRLFCPPPYSIGRCPPQINDASWRLQYHVKVHLTRFGARVVSLFHLFLRQTKMLFPRQNDQIDKVNEPFYLIALNTEVRMPLLYLHYPGCSCMGTFVRKIAIPFIPFY